MVFWNKDDVLRLRSMTLPSSLRQYCGWRSGDHMAWTHGDAE